MIRATKIKDLEGFNGHTSLYKLSKPVEYGTVWDDDGNEAPEGQTDHIVISATNVMFSGPETYIFAADKTGEVISWSEMPGSFKGGLDHNMALSRAGFELQQ